MGRLPDSLITEAQLMSRFYCILNLQVLNMEFITHIKPSLLPADGTCLMLNSLVSCHPCLTVKVLD